MTSRSLTFRPCGFTVALFIALHVVSSDADARSCRPELIPNGGVNQCLNCHVLRSGGGARTPFGDDVRKALIDMYGEFTPCLTRTFWGPALAALDSDGDGIPNGVELEDPEGLWRPGRPAPGDPGLVTNPGVLDCPREGMPGYADTHCSGIDVNGPGGNGPGTYVVSASGTDDAGDALSFTFTARKDGVELRVGPQALASAELVLGPGDWTIEVVVDDDCEGLAEDAVCRVELTVNTPPGVGPFQRGDSNGDGVLDLSDASHTLNFLFRGGPAPPCAAAMDSNFDGVGDLSDASYSLNFLFLGGPAPGPPFPDCFWSDAATDADLGCDAMLECF